MRIIASAIDGKVVLQGVSQALIAVGEDRSNPFPRYGGLNYFGVWKKRTPFTGDRELNSDVDDLTVHG